MYCYIHSRVPLKDNLFSNNYSRDKKKKSESYTTSKYILIKLSD